MQNFLLNRSLHKQVILLTISITDQARVDTSERFETEELSDGFVRVVARYGFMEQPDIPDLLRRTGVPGWSIEHTTFFLGRETVLAMSGTKGMPRWRKRLFAFMSQSSQRAATFFKLPPDRVLEIGSQIQL